MAGSVEAPVGRTVPARRPLREVTREPRRLRRLAAGLVCLVALAAAGALAVVSGAVGAAYWWTFNTVPPAIEANVPAGPLRGELAVPVAVRSGGRAVLERVMVDGVAVFLVDPPVPAGNTNGGRVLAIDTSTLADGKHALVLSAVDESRRHNRTNVQMVLVTDNTPPQLKLEAEALRLRAGQVTAVRVSANEPAQLGGTWGTDALPLIALPGTDGPASLALVALPVTAMGGEIAVQTDGRDAAGNASRAGLTLPVDGVTLPRQALEVPPSLAHLATGPVASAEAAQMASLTSAVRPERLWRGEFRSPLPVSYPRTTGFGDRRDYADGYLTYHAGYDVAAPMGTAVPAAAAGIVVFAGQMQQRGNCVIVDHGWGVYTVYAHFSRIDVQAGQSVDGGQIVGLVGTTGLSTGAHLHWEVRLRGMAVDPTSWLALSKTL